MHFTKWTLFPYHSTFCKSFIFFLSVPTMWERKKKVAKGWFPTPFLHLRWGSDFPQTVPWDSSEKSRTEGADFREVTAPPLRNLRRPGDPEVTAIRWGCGVLVGRMACIACPHRNVSAAGVTLRRHVMKHSVYWEPRLVWPGLPFSWLLWWLLSGDCVSCLILSDCCSFLPLQQLAPSDCAHTLCRNIQWSLKCLQH